MSSRYNMWKFKHTVAAALNVNQFSGLIYTQNRLEPHKRCRRVVCFTESRITMINALSWWKKKFRYLYIHD